MEEEISETKEEIEKAADQIDETISDTRVSMETTVEDVQAGRADLQEMVVEEVEKQISEVTEKANWSIWASQRIRSRFIWQSRRRSRSHERRHGGESIRSKSGC